MAVLVFWAFIAYGWTSIIVWGSIFEKPRNYIIQKSKILGSLISCTLCTSVWVGFLLSLLTGGLSNTVFPDLHRIFQIFLDMMFTGGTVWVINSISEYYEENRINDNKKEIL